MIFIAVLVICILFNSVYSLDSFWFLFVPLFLIMCNIVLISQIFLWCMFLFAGGGRHVGAPWRPTPPPLVPGDAPAGSVPGDSVYFHFFLFSQHPSLPPLVGVPAYSSFSLCLI